MPGRNLCFFRGDASEGPLVRRVLAVNGGAGGDLRLGVDGFRLCADLSCLMATISDPQH